MLAVLRLQCLRDRGRDPPLSTAIAADTGLEAGDRIEIGAACPKRTGKPVPGCCQLRSDSACRAPRNAPSGGGAASNGPTIAKRSRAQRCSARHGGEQRLGGRLTFDRWQAWWNETFPSTRNEHGTVEKIGVKKGLEHRGLAGVVRK